MTPTWRYQHDSGSVVKAYPTDVRGLRFRQQCGYVRVCMDEVWMPIAEAIQRVERKEQYMARVA